MPAEDATQVVVGGTMAALIAADAIAAEGRSVRLLLPERGVGGGFAPIRRDGRVLELGVRLLELDFEDTTVDSPPLDGYVAGTTTARPWARVVGDWVRTLAGERLRAIGPPQMVLDGPRRAGDALFTVDLTGLVAALREDERATMLEEARAALAATGADAGVLAPEHAEAFAAMSLEEASLANHGPRFHATVIAPLCDKVLAGGARAVAAPLRRKAWAPLFWPATLVQALAGEPIAFRPTRTFETLAPEGCGLLVDLLLERLRARDEAELVTAGELTGIAPAGDAVALTFSGHDALTVRHPILALAPGSLFGAAGVSYEVPRVTTAIAWLEADAGAAADVPDLVHVLDPGNPVLRVSRGGMTTAPGRALLTVELRHDADPDRLAEEAARGLRDAGLLAAPVEPVMAAARPTFPVPARATLEAFAQARAAYDALGVDAVLAGGALDVTADTLNDQILQGLQAAARTS
jgi:hypothetical protein